MNEGKREGRGRSSEKPGRHPGTRFPSGARGNSKLRGGITAACSAPPSTPSAEAASATWSHHLTLFCFLFLLLFPDGNLGMTAVPTQLCNPAPAGEVGEGTCGKGALSLAGAGVQTGTSPPSWAGPPPLPPSCPPASIKVSARVVSPASRGDPGGRGCAKVDKRKQQENGQELPTSAEWCTHEQPPSAGV